MHQVADRISLAMPLADTLKSSDENQRVANTIPRLNLWRAQTPQMFRAGLLRRGLEARPDATDESQAVEAVGHSAPRLGEVELDAAQAREYFVFLVRQVVRMLCEGMIHGDLSEYNVLVDAHGPVIIDLPQAVSAAGNNHARAMLLRDVNKLRSALAFFAPDLDMLHFGEEMWALFEAGELQPDTPLTGRFDFSTHEADVGAVLMSIEDARQEAVIRQQGREAAESAD